MATPCPPKLKLHHRTPGWIPDGETFHIRIRIGRAQPIPLTAPILATAVLGSVRLYHERMRWHCFLFLLMPDHLHALLAFPPLSTMSRTIGEWKKYHAQHHHVLWQDGYFDHRIRHAREFEEKATYIRQNPLVKNFCARAEDWLWVIDHRGGPRTPCAPSST